MNVLAEYMPLLPEVILFLGTLLLLMTGVFNEQQGAKVVWGLAMPVLGAAIFFLIKDWGVNAVLFNGSFVVDDFARLLKVMVLLGGIVTLYMSVTYLSESGLFKPEYTVLLLFSLLGMMMMLSANDLIAMYLGLEVQSLALYVVASFRRDSVRSSEAGMKYFVLGALSSGMLLYGCSMVYGFTGSINFEDIAKATITEGAPSVGMVIGLVFILAGLAFKISAVPFHMWTPDVYEGAPTPVTAFFAACPKIAAMGLLIRVIHSAFPEMQPQWNQIIIFISIASMLLGAFGAIGQTNIKRLMAYSSIGHMGFALVGVAAGNREGIEGVLVYLMIYLIMTVGAFACILAMRRNEEMVENIEDLRGLSQTNLPAAFMFAMLMFSLAGIPPLAGFFAKFYVFMAAVKADMFVLAVVGVLASVVGAFYYLRIIKIMFFDEPKEGINEMPSQLKIVLGLSGMFVLLYVVYPNPIIDSAKLAAKALLPTV
ncbi:MAG: NADH-quinone oxidoreductase subunit N [Rhodomicrobium sp.]|nr:MAG: NADH-quinone oxidoreductase subunit N [Rhodomicrobium sp.]